MERVIIRINTVNAAFEQPENEVARMLIEIANKLVTNLYKLNYNGCMDLRDINGNKVGTITFE